MRKLLSVLIILFGLMPLCLGGLSVASYPKALEMLKVQDSPDVYMLVTIVGVCLLSLAILQFVAGIWTWKGSPYGVMLCRVAGCLMLMDGIVMHLKLDRPDISVPDIAKGLIILVIAFLVKKDKS